MDCQNESYSDLDSLRVNRPFVCDQCAEKTRAQSDNKTEERAPLALDSHFEFYSDSPAYSSTELEVIPRDERAIELEDSILTPEPSDEPAEIEVLELPEIETHAPLSEGKICSGQIADSLRGAASEVLENNQDPEDVYYAPALPEQKQDLVTPLRQESDLELDPQLSNTLPAIESERVKGMRLMAFSTSKQIVIGVACVLLIVLMQTLFAPSRQSSVKAESFDNPTPTATAKVEPSIPTKATQNSATPVATPLPAPVIEEKPTPAPTPTTQPIDKPKGLFTVQVGSHQNVAEANQQADKLRAAGFNPRVVSADIPKRGLWYRVQVGDFNSRDEANRFGATLRAKGVADNFIISDQ